MKDMNDGLEEMLDENESEPQEMMDEDESELSTEDKEL